MYIEQWQIPIVGAFCAILGVIGYKLMGKILGD